MSSRTTGARRENEVCETLQKIGFLTQRAYQKVRWIGPGRTVSQSADFFGCIDIVAVRSNSPVRLIQVGTQANSSTKRSDVAATLSTLAFSPHYSVEVWSWGRWPWLVPYSCRNFRGIWRIEALRVVRGHVGWDTIAWTHRGSWFPQPHSYDSVEPVAEGNHADIPPPGLPKTDSDRVGDGGLTHQIESY